MKKKFLILPVLAALFAACTSDELVVVDNQTQQTEEDAIAFDAYLTRSVTRAGKPGNMTLESDASGDVKLKVEGFGVFAYYANGDLYSENAIPDFMYNQMVNYDGGWKYSPIKYWPNEFGSSAISTGVDRVTFFAYAPYVTVDPSTGQLTSAYNGTTDALSTETGITALTRNGKTGDPYVRYVGAFDPAKCVDLCYGVAAADYNSYVGAADGANSVKKGDPYINIAKPALDDNSKIFFDFKHALAQLNVQIDADVDITGHDNSGEPAVDPLTRIWVRSISFDGIAQRGYLNLNSGMWYDVIDNTKISHASVTVYDGRRDGAEAIADDSYEAPIGLNPSLVQNVGYTTTTTTLNGLTVYNGITAPTTGVTNSLQNLFNGSNLLVIPANEQLKVTIVYDVETADATLSSYLSDGVTKGKSVENKITKSITLNGGPLKLESGKRYDLKLHLGMNSVKFNASVSEWQDADGAEEYLPYNLPVYTAAAPGAATITLPASTTSYQFAVSGFTGNEAVTATGTSPVTDVTVDNNAANSGGVAIVTATIDDNNTVNDVTQASAITVTGSSSSKNLVVKLIQKAAPLGLFVAPANQKISGDKNIVLSSGITDWYTAVGAVTNTDESSIFVYKNGTPLHYEATPLADGDFTWDAGTQKITLYTAATAGDVYTITVKAGDAAAETISFTVKKKDGELADFTNSAKEYDIYAPSDPSQTTTASGDGNIIYGIAKKSGSGTTTAVIDKNTGSVTLNNCEKNDVFTVTATIADGVNYTYAEKTKTYTITIVDSTP